MKYSIFSLILLLALLLETAVVQLPFVLICLILLGVLYKQQWVFLAAFLAGIVLDMLAFRTIGSSSLFFVVMLGIVFLYMRKFEIQTMQFVSIFSFLAAVFNGLFFGQSYILLTAFVTTILSSVLFSLFTSERKVGFGRYTFGR